MSERRRNCPAAEDLSAFIDGELDSAARARLAAHIARCPACADRLRQFGAADAAAESATTAELAPELRLRLESIPIEAAARRRRTVVALAAAATVLVAALLALNSKPAAALRRVSGDAARDAGRVSATSAAEFAARGGWVLALEKGAVVDVDEASGSLLLVSGRARCVAEKGIAGSLRTPAGDVRFEDGSCEVSVEGIPSKLDPGRSTCRVLVEAAGNTTEWRTPAGEKHPLKGGEALFREVDLRAFGPSPSTTVAAVAASRSLELYVYDTDGLPLGGASVRLVAPSGAETGHGVTAESGRTEILGVPFGDYRLRVEKPGVGDKEIPIAVEAGETTPRSVFVHSRG